MQEEKIRYYFVDGIRGVAIINMVIFHFLYDVYIVYEKSPTGIAFRQSISGNRRYAAHSFLFLVLYGYGEKKRIYGVESYLIFWGC